MQAFTSPAGTTVNGYVAKVDPDTGMLIWNTFVGNGADNVKYFRARSVVVDNSGNVFVAGSSYQPFDAVWGNVVNEYNAAGNYDVWLAKLDIDGNYLWHTFFNNSSLNIYPVGQTITPDGNVTVVASGGIGTLLLPVTRQYGAGGSSDLLFYKFNNATGARIWQTIFGGAGAEIGQITHRPATDNANNIYFPFYARQAGLDNPVPLNAKVNPNATGLVKLNQNGELVWHTYLNEIGGEIYRALAIVNGSTLYLAGAETGTTDLFTAAPLSAHSIGTSSDFLLAAFDLNGAYQWHTYAGGDSWDLDRFN